MNEFSSFERSPYPQAAPITQQSDAGQVGLLRSPADSLSGYLPLLMIGLFVAVAFFRMGIGVGKRSRKHYDLIQTLERIWQMSSNRND